LQIYLLSELQKLKNMALKKEKKSELIKKYTELLNQAKTFVYVKFKGLNVKETEVLRKSLFAEGINYTVVKKTLWQKALETQKISGEKSVLGEEMAVIFSPDSKDLLAPARIAYNFAKTHKGVFGILGGIFEGVFKDVKSMTEIAIIPAREVLLSQLAFLLKSPIQKLAIGISEVAKKK